MSLIGLSCRAAPEEEEAAAGSPESVDQSRVSISKSDDSVSTLSASIPAEHRGSGRNGRQAGGDAEHPASR